MENIWASFKESVEQNKLLIQNNTKLIDAYINDHFKEMTTIHNFSEMSENVVLEVKEEIDINIEETLTLGKYFCFLTSSFLDQLVCLKGLLKHETSWEKLFFANKAALIVYETFETDKKYQKSFSNQINDYPKLEITHKEIVLITRTLLKQENINKLFGDIRNKVAAHYHGDFPDYFKLTAALDEVRAENVLHLSLGVIKLKMQLISSMLDLHEMS